MFKEGGRNEMDLLKKGRQDEDKPGDYECGLGAWKPQWLQRFATSKWFMIIYGMLGTVQAMAYIYFISILTTIEKRFGIQTKTTGLMLSGNELSQIMLAPLLSFYGGQRNRPVWIAWGVALSAVSCFILAFPHFLYGPGPVALSLTVEYQDQFKGMNHSLIEHKEKLELCSAEKLTNEDCTATTNEDLITPLLVFLSQFVLGIGTTLYYSLGQPYVDDNSKKANTPLILGVTMALRTVGPSIGFLITFLCLHMYIDPTLTPTIKPDDPRWLGAWWLGWLILGSVMLGQGFLIAFFPKKLKKKPKKKVEVEKIPTLEQPLRERGDINSNGTIVPVVEEKEDKPPTMKDFIPSLVKLMKNKLLMLNMFAGVFYVLGASGYMTYMTKNMEVQFYKSAAKANIIIGPVVLLSMVLAFILSGFVISKFKPRPRYLLGWNVIVGLFSVIQEILFIFIACPDVPIVGYNLATQSLGMLNECNSQCGCEFQSYAPVCLEEVGQTFFSACHAGCKTINRNGSLVTYGNCSCIPTTTEVTIPAISANDYLSYKYETYGGTVRDGNCFVDCALPYAIFVIASCLRYFLGSTGRIGNILVNYRAVSPEQKSFAQGMALFTLSLLAFIPGPIIFGYIIDGTCLVWDTTCGKEGSCSFYDRNAFRRYLNGTAACCTLMGVILDAFVCYYGKDLPLYDAEEERRNSYSKENIKKDLEKMQQLNIFKENT